MRPADTLRIMGMIDNRAVAFWRIRRHVTA